MCAHAQYKKIYMPNLLSKGGKDDESKWGEKHTWKSDADDDDVTKFIHLPLFKHELHSSAHVRITQSFMLRAFDVKLALDVFIYA